MRHLTTTHGGKHGIDHTLSVHEPLREIDDGEGKAMLVPEVETKFVWRKHAKLHEYMQRLYFQFGYRKKSVRNDRDEFNCNPMPLDTDAVIGLEAAIKGNDLPTSLGGLFFGHEFKDERDDYRDKTLSSQMGEGELKPRNTCTTTVGGNCT